MKAVRLFPPKENFGDFIMQVATKNGDSGKWPRTGMGVNTRRRRGPRPDPLLWSDGRAETDASGDGQRTGGDMKATLQTTGPAAPAASALSGRPGQYLHMARSVRGRHFDTWPAWSTGEALIVALLLNDVAALDRMSYTVIEAFDRIDLDVPTMRRIERELQS